MSIVCFLAALFCITVASAANSPDAFEDEAPDNGAEMIWQYAFWAIVAIALGAETQPSGIILGMPPGWGFALKCSPVMCLWNAIEALQCIRIERKPAWRLSIQSAKYSASSRQVARDGGTAQTGGSTVVRGVLFVLGPLPQAIKPFACTGIPHSKVLATYYLARFICDELVLNLIKLTGSSSQDVASFGVMASMFYFSREASKQPEGIHPTA